MRLLFILLILTNLTIAQTKVEKINTNWQLTVNGKSFEVKGVTFGFDKDTANYVSYFKDLNFLGVNTIRTWATGSNTKKLLDAAHKQNIKVMLGIWMRHGRPGMEDDDSFNYLEDVSGMEKMYNNAINVAKTYKDHPALLTYGIGNEVYLNMATDEEKLAYSKFLERICSNVKTLDPNHPITSVEAWTFGLDWWQKHVPSIDIYGLNSYGFGASLLNNELNKRTIDKPYIITEFGVTGEWDIKSEKLGIKIEPSDAQKYDAIAKGFKEWIITKPNCLGAYVFHYSDGKNHIAPWLFTHVSGSKRPQYWAIRKAYKNENPINYVPKIESFKIENASKKSDVWLTVNLKVSDVENDNLNVSFGYNQRKGSRKRRDQILPLQFRGNIKDGFEIKTPKENGTLKIYANIKDSYNNVGIASYPISIEDSEIKERNYLVPKVNLPFYVYKDNAENTYAASGYMGNYDALKVDVNHNEIIHSGTKAIKINYSATDNWYGIAFVDPANDWGDILGGYDISGAKTFSFWAKASDSNIKVLAGFGLIEKDKPYPDTAKKAIDISLGTEWKKYTIKLKKLDLSCIRSGFVLFGSGEGFSHQIYIDDIVFE